jgi:cobalt-zinc-cadmium efflux system outer membrane protein
MDGYEARRRSRWSLIIAMIGFAPSAAIAQVRLDPPRVLDARPYGEIGRCEEKPPAGILTLDDLLRISLDQNPNLRQADIEIEAARGRAVQAGLYPNPIVSVNLDELGDKTGPGGVNTLPLVSQEIVTAGKLRLNRSVAERDVDEAALAFVRQRFTLFTNVRQGYFTVLAIRQRIEVLADLVKLATQSHDNAKKLREQGLIADLDLFPFEVEMNRFQADLEAAQREEIAAWGQLAATMGVPNMPSSPLRGSLEDMLPDYAFDPVRAYMLTVHPDTQIAQVGLARSEIALKRAQVEPIPNVMLGAGYVRQNQNRSDDWTLQVGVPVPVFNRNQGNVRAAHAKVNHAIAEVSRVENDLTNKLWNAFGNYSAARKRVDRYRTAVIPAADKTYRLAFSAFQGGQFEYLRVLQALRAVQEAKLEYIRAMADAWRAASEIAGLLLEEQWPPPPHPLQR